MKDTIIVQRMDFDRLRFFYVKHFVMKSYYFAPVLFGVGSFSQNYSHNINVTNLASRLPEYIAVIPLKTFSLTKQMRRLRPRKF